MARASVLTDASGLPLAYHNTILIIIASAQYVLAIKCHDIVVVQAKLTQQQDRFTLLQLDG